MQKKKKLLFLNTIDKSLINKDFKNIKVFSLPMIKTIARKFVDADLKSNFPWVITSQNAAKLISKKKLPDKVYTIGEQTAKYFKNSITPKKSCSVELAKLIVSNNEKEIIYLCGNQRRNELPEYLLNFNIKVNELIIYDTKYLDKIVNLHDYDALAFMSPSSVLAMQKSNGFGELPCFAIGLTTAKTLNKIGLKCVISDNASVKSIIEAAQNYFK